MLHDKTMVPQIVQNSIFKFREIFIFGDFFIFKGIFIFSEILIFRDFFIFSEIFIFRACFMFRDIFIFREIFIFRNFFIFRYIFMFSGISVCTEFFLKIAVSKMLRSFSVEQPCWSPFKVHLQAFLRTYFAPASRKRNSTVDAIS